MDARNFYYIYRRKYDQKLRERLADRYKNYSSEDCDLANEWWVKFCSLPAEKLEIAKSIISLNSLKKETMNVPIKKFLMYCHIIALHETLRKGIPKEVYVGGGEPKC